VHHDYESLLSDPTIDIVYIALHNSAHEEWVVRSLLADKHVVCEKPLGLDADEVGRMIDVARRAGRLLVEACWNQWHPRFRELVRIVRDGELGEVRFARSFFHGERPVRGDYRNDPALGGGALYDVGCYAIAGALTAFGGQAPLSVTASREVTDQGVDALTRAALDFGSGTALVEAGLKGGATEGLLVRGVDQEIELTHPAFTATGEVTLIRRSARGQSIATFPPVNPYRLMVEAISAAAQGEEVFVVDVDASLLVAQVVDEVRSAANSGPAPHPSGTDI
jgi:predicted dehydrogenase